LTKSSECFGQTLPGESREKSDLKMRSSDTEASQASVFASRD
jgi:hypothetical protein